MEKQLLVSFAGNVKTMEARGYWRDYGSNVSQGYHYGHNAETYMRMRASQ